MKIVTDLEALSKASGGIWNNGMKFQNEENRVLFSNLSHPHTIDPSYFSTKIGCNTIKKQLFERAAFLGTKIDQQSLKLLPVAAFVLEVLAFRKAGMQGGISLSLIRRSQVGVHV